MSLRFRKFVVIGAGAALLLAVTAGPLAAASKTYTVSVNPKTLPYNGATSQSSPFSFTFTNTTPSASINSVTLTAPSGYTITGVTGATEGSVPTGNATFTPTTITVTNLNPLNNGDSVTIAFSASIDTSSLTCQNNVGAWVPTAYNGSNLSGSVFSPTNTATTTIGSTLAAGATVTVDGVTVKNNGACTPVTISRSADTVTILKPSGVAFTVDILWDPVLATAPMTTWTQVDTPSPTHDILWCGGTASAPALPNSTEVSCLISETSQVYGPDASGAQQVQVKDHILLLGDIVWSR